MSTEQAPSATAGAQGMSANKRGLLFLFGIGSATVGFAVGALVALISLRSADAHAD